MRPGRALADAQPCGDALVRLARGEEAEDLRLSGRELLRPVVTRAGPQRSRQATCDDGIELHLAAMRGPDGDRHLVCVRVLEQVAGSTGLESRVHARLVAERRDDDDSTSSKRARISRVASIPSTGSIWRSMSTTSGRAPSESSRVSVSSASRPPSASPTT